MTDADYETGLERPIVQESHMEGHVEFVFPAGHDTVVVDDALAHKLAEDILRITDREETDAC